MPRRRWFLSTKSAGPRTDWQTPPAAGLVAWYDAVYERTFSPVSGNPLATAHDRSGNGADMTQATAGNRPTWTDGIRLCKPYYVFNGSNTFYTAPSGPNLTDGRTFYVFHNPTILSGTQPIIDDQAQSLRLFDQGGATNKAGWSDGGGAHAIADIRANAYQTLCWVFSGSSGSLYQQVAGSSYPSAAPTLLGTASWTGASQSGTWMWGTESTQTTWLLAQVGEILIYNVAHDDPTRLLIMNYLDQKWNTCTA